MRFGPFHFRCQFGLGGLFLATAIAACSSYWLARPSILANRFVAAMDTGDYVAVERLFLEHGVLEAPQTRFGTEEQVRRATIKVAPLTWDDLFHRRRRIYVHVPYGEGALDGTFGIDATPSGLRHGSFNT